MHTKDSNDEHLGTWAQRLAAAEQEVSSLLRRLPPPLRLQAETVPVRYEHRPGRDLLDDGFDDDLLGLFVGVPFPDGESEVVDLPAQIVLFLDNLWDMAEGVAAVYREEVRTTYLHELGHYLGLDEEGLRVRDLE